MTINESVQIARINRSVGLGGTDAMRIMNADWPALYREKVGEAEPVDLSGVFKVQLGIRTEAFHGEWFARMTGIETVEPESFYLHAKHPFMFAHIDRWLPDKKTFVELKHSRAGVTAWDRSRYYMAQLQHYMAVLDVDYCYFSVIRGNEEPQIAIVERDNEYVEGLIKMLTSFWWHVENRVAPDITPTGEIGRLDQLAKGIKVDGKIVADMRNSNAWVDAEQRFIMNNKAAKAFEVAKKDLKALVTEDIGEAIGNSVTIKRNKSGNMLIKIKGEADNDNG